MQSASCVSSKIYYGGFYNFSDLREKLHFHRCVRMSILSSWQDYKSICINWGCTNPALLVVRIVSRIRNTSCKLYFTLFTVTWRPKHARRTADCTIQRSPCLDDKEEAEEDYEKKKTKNKTSCYHHDRMKNKVFGHKALKKKQEYPSKLSASKLYLLCACMNMCVCGGGACM